MYIDIEYLTLEWLNENAETSQRQLSKILGISLGSVNVMLAKMQRDGLIKIKNITHNKVMYMLTPEGLAEKANKTIRYVVRNYKYINDMKVRIKDYILSKLETEEKLYLLVDDSETSQIVMLAIDEMGATDKFMVVKELPSNTDSIMTLLVASGDNFVPNGIRVEIIWEKI